MSTLSDTGVPVTHPAARLFAVTVLMGILVRLAVGVRGTLVARRERRLAAN